MGGEIGVESAPGSGSRFWFEVPLPPAAAPDRVGRPAPHILKGRRVLVVDDVEMNRRILVRQLAGLGMETAEAADGFAAIAEIERATHARRPFDLLMIDQMMPGLSGDGLARRLRAASATDGAKLLVVSSAGTYGLTPDAKALFDAVLMKPLREAALLDALSQVFGAAPPASPAPAVAAEPAQPARPLRVLLVEDNKINQTLVAALLETARHDVRIAENGEEAVEAVREHEFDVVLMDLQMPVLDGLAATKQIRALGSPRAEVTIVALTANAMAGTMAQCLAAGMNGYLSKPIDAAALHAKLAEVAAAKRPEPAEPVAAAPAVSPARAVVPDLSRHALVDPARLDALRAVMKPQTIRDLVLDFLRHLDECASQPRDLARPEALSEAGRVAHTIAGTAGSLGATGLSELAGRVDIACRTPDAIAAERLLPEFQESAAAVSAWFRAWLLAERQPVPAEPHAA